LVRALAASVIDVDTYDELDRERNDVLAVDRPVGVVLCVGVVAAVAVVVAVTVVSVRVVVDVAATLK